MKMRNAILIFILSISISFQLTILLGDSFIPPKWVFPDNEILWFQATNSLFVICRENGEVSAWDINRGTKISDFKIVEYRFIYDQLFITDNSLPRFAVLRAHWRKPFIEIYSLLTGENEKAFECPGSPGLRGLGFNSIGKFFFYYEYQTTYCIDVVKEKIHWKLKHKDYPASDSVVFDDGKRIGFFAYGRTLIVNRYGRRVWQTKNEEGVVFYEPLRKKDINEARDELLVYIKDTGRLDDEISHYVALNKKGKIAWERRGYDILLAISTDGKKQIFNTEDDLLVTSLPEDKVIRLNVKDRIEAVFTPNGKYLITLSLLMKTGEDEEVNQAFASRKDHVIHIFNTETGKEIKSWNLDKTDNRSNSN